LRSISQRSPAHLHNRIKATHLARGAYPRAFRGYTSTFDRRIVDQRADVLAPLLQTFVISIRSNTSAVSCDRHIRKRCYTLFDLIMQSCVNKDAQRRFLCTGSSSSGRNHHRLLLGKSHPKHLGLATSKDLLTTASLQIACTSHP
jgi:hypothetical protein